MPLPGSLSGSHTMVSLGYFEGDQGNFPGPPTPSILLSWLPVRTFTRWTSCLLSWFWDRYSLFTIHGCFRTWTAVRRWWGSTWSILDTTSYKGRQQKPVRRASCAKFLHSLSRQNLPIILTDSLYLGVKCLFSALKVREWFLNFNYRHLGGSPQVYIVLRILHARRNQM